MTIRSGLLCGVAVLAAVVYPAGATVAQSSSATGVQPSGILSSDEIIVTARRRAETAQETPVAITVLNDALLDRYGIKGIAAITQLTPGLVTAEASGAVGGTISLRGIGSGDSQPFIDQAVSINIDGVQVSSAQPLRAAQLDVKQIEILRGPQTLFFGKNSPGGIISIVSADPGDTPELMARAGYEFKANERYVELTASGPLSDIVGVRLASRYSEMDGYINVVIPEATDTARGLGAFPRQKELFLRGTVSIRPSDRFTVRLKATRSETDAVGGPSYFSDVTACPYGLPQETPVVAGNCSNDGTIITAPLPSEFLALHPLMGNDSRGFRDNRQTLLSGTIDYDLTDTLALTSVTGYYEVDERVASNGSYGFGGVSAFGLAFSTEQFSQELRLASRFDAPLNFLVGGLYEQRDLYTSTFIGVPASGTSLPVETTSQGHETYSVFGQLLWDVASRLQLTAGARYTHEVKDLLTYVIERAGSPAVDVVEDPRYPGTRLTFNNVSPEFSLTYKPIADVMLFLSYKKGFKSGGFDASYTAGGILANPGRGQAFDPEKVSGVEGGLKSSLADRQVTLNLTGYWYNYKDLQVSSFDNVARAFKTQNAARARVRGVEVESSYRPQAVPGLTISVSAAYNDARFQEYLADCYAGQSEALGCNAVQNPLTGRFTSQDLSGHRLRKAPVFTATAGSYYEFALASDLMFSLSANLAYSGDYIASSNYQPLGHQPSFAKIDATIRLFREDDRWELALIGRNLTNKRNLVNALDRTGTGGLKGGLSTCSTLAETGCDRLADIVGTPALPRTIAVQFTARY